MSLSKPPEKELKKKLALLEEEVKNLKKSQVALLQSEERFKALMEQNPNSIEIYSPDGTQEEVNFAWQELFGLKPEDTVGKYNCLKDEQAVKAGSALAFEHVLADKPISIPDIEYDPGISGYPKGRKRWLRSNFFPIKDHKGNIRHVVLIHEDITQRIKTEEKYKLVVENSNESIFVIRNSYIPFYNQKLIDLTGYHPEEIAQKKFYEYVHPDDRERIINVHKNRLVGEKVPPLIQFRIVGKTGEIKWLQTNAVIIDWDGTPAALVFATDITELKKAEEKLNQYHENLEQQVIDRTHALSETNKKLSREIRDREKAENAVFEEKNKIEAILAAVGDALTVQDREFRILYQNQAHIAKQGYHAGEICYRAYQNRDAVCDGCVLEKCFYDGKIHNRETSAVTPDGTFYMEVTASPLKDARGNIIAGVEIVRDITDVKNLTNQLLQNRKMEAIGTLAGGIAHDFNNILTGILGYAELAMLDAQMDKTNPEAIGQIIAASKRAADLVRQILTFSRRRDEEFLCFQLQPIIKEALKLLRGSLPSTIDIKYTIDPQCGPINGNMTQLHQVLVNLSTNALHAMRDKGGELDIRLQEVVFENDVRSAAQTIPAGKFACLSVADTGSGMTEETISRIFDPYYTNKELGEGAGLGLATVHGIVENHKGYITVESKIDKGSRFCVYLPVVPDCSQEVVEIKKHHLAANLDCKVLLIDDEAIVRKVTKKTLEQMHCQVSDFGDSTEALAVFKADPAAYDIIFTDQTMPKLTGYELARQVLTIRPDMPIILATGYSETVDKTKAEQAGIKQFIMKPFDIQTLTETLLKVLGLS